MKLKEIAMIKTGVVLSRKEYRGQGEPYKYKLLTLKCLNEDGTLNLEYIEEFTTSGEVGDYYLVKEGDVIIRLTTPYTASFVPREAQGSIISSNFALIRLHGSAKILPLFLSSLLNMESLKRKFSQSSFGSVLPMIKTNQIKEIEIKEISLAKQKTIVNWLELYYQEKRLFSKFAEQRDLTKKAVLEKFLN